MNGEVKITDLVISKLLRKNIEKYRALYPHVAAAIRLNVSGVITNRGDNIQYVHTDSSHIDPLHRITPAKLISTYNYDRSRYALTCLWILQEQYCRYLDLIGRCLDSTKRKAAIGGMSFTSSVIEILRQQEQSCRERVYSQTKMYLLEIETMARLYRHAI